MKLFMILKFSIRQYQPTNISLTVLPASTRKVQQDTVFSPIITRTPFYSISCPLFSRVFVNRNGDPSSSASSSPFPISSFSFSPFIIIFNSNLKSLFISSPFSSPRVRIPEFGPVSED